MIVKWTGSWDDARKEIDAANALIEEKQVDVITYHQNQTNVIKAAEEKGVASIGYHQLYEDASELQLTAAVSNWEIAYREIIREYLQGKSSATRFYWLGLHNDVVALSEYSGLVSEEAREAVEKAREEILGGKDVFSGVIYDNKGNLRCGENEMISDKELLEGFDWYAEGVEFYEE